MTRTTKRPDTAAGQPGGNPHAEGLLLTDLHKTYVARGREPFEAVKGLDLDIRPGELVALLGPSGCGKTTTLRMIAGLETTTSGEIRIGDRVVQDLPPAKRNVGVGFESYALYPPLNVRENLAYGLKARGVKDANERVQRLAERLDMTDMLDLRPAGLSSGQKQRVALARALVRNPPVLLLDEPLSHLDMAARQRVRRELKMLQREFGYTTIVVTHDQLEALSLADRMAVMNAGIIMQFGTPDEIYDDPANTFTADFVGEPKINLFEGIARRQDGEVGVAVGRDGFLTTAAREVADGQPVTVGLRPQDCRVATEGERAIGAEVVVFENVLEYGLATLDVATLDGRMVAQTPGDVQWRTGDQARITSRPDRVYLFDVDSGERIR
jgi:multiple sugar transport system ATP-binding protein